MPPTRQGERWRDSSRQKTSLRSNSDAQVRWPKESCWRSTPAPGRCTSQSEAPKGDESTSLDSKAAQFDMLGLSSLSSLGHCMLGRGVRRIRCILSVELSPKRGPSVAKSRLRLRSGATQWRQRVRKARQTWRLGDVSYSALSHCSGLLFLGCSTEDLT